MSSYNYQPLEDVMHTWTTTNVKPVMTFEAFPQNNVTMFAGGTEMLKVDKEGFYVRGTKVPVDDKEAETVYNAFKSFLMWAELNKP
jgi:hypothetical protein